MPSLDFGCNGGSEGKASAYNAGDLGLILESGRYPWRRKWQLTPVLLPGKSHGWRSLVGYSPCSCEKLNTTEWLSLHFSTLKRSESEVAQLCPTLCDPMDYTVHGILQARILEWVAFPFSRGFSQPRDQTQVSFIAGRFFTSWASREAQVY